MAETKSVVAPSTMTPPIPYTRMKQISNDACTTAFEKVEYYEHSRSADWNSTIVNHVLKALISESSTPSSPPTFKFAVNSTIIQHLTPTSALRSKAGQTSTGTSTSDSISVPGTTEAAQEEKKHVGRRGMHSATGAYWNSERDGMWSFKYEGDEDKGLDVVVCIIWMSMS